MAASKEIELPDIDDVEIIEIDRLKWAALKCGSINRFSGVQASFLPGRSIQARIAKNSGGDKIDAALGFNLFGGYRLFQHLAIEVNFNWYDDFERKAGAIDFDVSIWTLMLDLKVIFPL